MSPAPTAQNVAKAVAGSWQLGATNLPVWLGGTRSGAHFAFEVVTEDPLVVREYQRFTAEGKERGLVVTSIWARGEFVSRSTGVRRLARGRWRVLGINDDRSIVVVRTEKSAQVLDGLMVFVRSGSDASELRTTIANSSQALGLEPEDFASLGWLPVAEAHR